MRESFDLIKRPVAANRDGDGCAHGPGSAYRSEKDSTVAKGGAREGTSKQERERERERSEAVVIDKCCGRRQREREGQGKKRRQRRTGCELYPNVPITRFRSRISEFICTYTQA